MTGTSTPKCSSHTQRSSNNKRRRRRKLERRRRHQNSTCNLIRPKLARTTLTRCRRSSAVYRIARFPAPRSEKQRYCWKKCKEVCLKGLGYTPSCDDARASANRSCPAVSESTQYKRSWFPTNTPSKVKGRRSPSTTRSRTAQRRRSQRHV